MQQDIGKLLHLYLEDIQMQQNHSVHEFLVKGATEAIQAARGRNWVPLIVKQIGIEKFEVIANAFVFLAAHAAGLDKVWCVIADDSDETQKCARILTQESIPRINLATANRDEIQLAIDYLIKRPVNPLTDVKAKSLVDKIDSAPRQYWKETLIDVIQLKCGITKGKKLNIFKEVFYVIPQPLPNLITDPNLLNTFTVIELKAMAKKRGFSGYTKLKKSQLVELLSH